MKELVEMIAQELVDHPEQVRVDEVIGGSTCIVRLSVGDGETGKIIGRKGRTADAMRVLLSAAAAKDKRRVILEIDDAWAKGKHPVEGLAPRPMAGRR